MTLEDIDNGEYHYLSVRELEDLVERLEDSLRVIQREIKHRERYE